VSHSYKLSPSYSPVPEKSNQLFAGSGMGGGWAEILSKRKSALRGRGLPTQVVDLRAFLTSS